MRLSHSLMLIYVGRADGSGACQWPSCAMWSTCIKESNCTFLRVQRYQFFVCRALAVLYESPNVAEPSRSVSGLGRQCPNSTSTAAVSVLLCLRKLLSHLFVSVGELFVGVRCFPCLLGKIFTMGLHRHR